MPSSTPPPLQINGCSCPAIRRAAWMLPRTNLETDLKVVLRVANGSLLQLLGRLEVEQGASKLLGEILVKPKRKRLLELVLPIQQPF